MPLFLSQLMSLPANALMRILGDSCSRISYSQLGEDFIIHHALSTYFPNTKRGFYVDVGAHHPRRYSNTKVLHMMGWSGINIDASEKTISAFKQERPNDINICVGIGNKNGELTYYEFADSAVSTFSTEWAHKWRDEMGWKIVSTKSIPVRVLSELLNEVMPSSVPSVDVMSIDIEGLDESVTIGIDLNNIRYRPKVFAVELHNTDILECASNPAVCHLKDNGYRLIAINIATFIFIDTRLAVR